MTSQTWRRAPAAQAELERHRVAHRPGPLRASSSGRPRRRRAAIDCLAAVEGLESGRGMRHDAGIAASEGTGHMRQTNRGEHRGGPHAHRRCVPGGPVGQECDGLDRAAYAGRTSRHAGRLGEQQHDAAGAAQAVRPAHHDDGCRARRREEEGDGDDGRRGRVLRRRAVQRGARGADEVQLGRHAGRQLRPDVAVRTHLGQPHVAHHRPAGRPHPRAGPGGRGAGTRGGRRPSDAEGRPTGPRICRSAPGASATARQTSGPATRATSTSRKGPASSPCAAR